MDPATLEYYLSVTPGLAPPPGVVPNFVNHPSRANEPRIVIAIALPLMLICVFMRIYTRCIITRSFGVDDFLCLVSAGGIVAWCIIVLTMLGHPLGAHQWDIPLIKLDATFQQRSLANICVYGGCAIFVKATLLTLYLRLFNPNEKARLIIWIGIIANTIFYTACIIIDLVQCLPRSGDGGWLGQKSQKRCGQPALNISTAQGVFSTLSDFYILVVPLHLVWSLNVNRKKKIGVSLIFLTGTLALVCSISSTVYRFRQVTSQDFTWEAIPVYAFSAAELNVGLICSCMPIIFVLFKNLGNKLLRISSFQYFYSRYRQKFTNDEAGSDKAGAHDGYRVEEVAVPKPTMTGIRSFIRRVHRPAGQTTQGQSEMYTELDHLNANEQYHAQLAPPTRDGAKKRPGDQWGGI